MSPDRVGLTCRKITNLGHQMSSYIERENRITYQWARQFNIANQLINNRARALRYKSERPAGIKGKGLQA